MSEQQSVEDLAQAYGRRAGSYADLWAPVLRPKGRALLDALDPSEARTFLDLGTGTGTLLAEIRAVAPGARVVAVDRSEGMLRLASRAAARSVMDAQAIALADGSIEAGVCAFVIFTVPDPRALMREAFRVLAPRARFGVATWGDEPDVPADAVWLEELAAAGAAADPVTPINSREITNTPEKLRARFEEAGFTGVRTWTDRLDLIWDADDYMRFVGDGGGFKRRLDTLDAGARERVAEKVRARLGTLPPEGFAERSEIVYATGVRP